MSKRSSFRISRDASRARHAERLARYSRRPAMSGADITGYVILSVCGVFFAGVLIADYVALAHHAAHCVQNVCF